MSLLLWGLLLADSPLEGAEPQWIWAAEHEGERVPQVSCYFRKEVSLRHFEEGRLVIAADDEYEVYINGRRVAAGQVSGQRNEHDITRFLTRGRNVIAIKATNVEGTTGGIAGQIFLKNPQGNWESIATDESWKTNLRPLPLWNSPFYSDALWGEARGRGTWQEAEPTPTRAKRSPTPAEPPAAPSVAKETPSSSRFRIVPNFELREVINDRACGSLLALAFNEFGHLIVSRDGGPLLLIRDTNGDSIPDHSREYCSLVKSSHGILPLNGNVYVTGDGPDGNALYKLSDENRDGILEKAVPLIKFRGSLSEHGPHGIVLGPDGWIYVVVGNHSSPAKDYAEGSPYRRPYEGDLVGPRYEDPGGHAVGIKAPGGVVLRTTDSGDKVECVAGGIRNAYDLVFHTDGSLFLHDSDMETDLGTTWYRPTQLFLVTPGAEFGWRSGWASWPDYYVDAVPPVLKTGRGSPTGAICYSHYMFPKKYQNALFLGDWSEGRIIAVFPKAEGSGYSATAEVFMEGRPLNVTDLDVSPDGALYFVTGGRGTEGGVFRVAWKGEVPASVTNLGDGISAAIRQPQVQSAWGRQKVAAVRQELGDRWEAQLLGVARATANPTSYRIRALDLMQLLGPAPSSDYLLKLSRDDDPIVRARVAELLALVSNETAKSRLKELLQDTSPMVRRRTCDALARANIHPPAEDVLELLASEDRLEAGAARGLLERLPLDSWQEAILATDDHRQFIHGALALLALQPEPETGKRVLARISELLAGFISDADFTDMLRLAQVALHRCGLAGEDVPELREQLAEEFPANNVLMNRELIRLVVYLQATSALGRGIEQLQAKESDLDKLHLAFHLRFFESGWKDGQKLEVLRLLEELKLKNAGSAVPIYQGNAARDLAKSVTADEARAILAQGDAWPNAALGSLYATPTELDDAWRGLFRELYEKLGGRNDEPTHRLKVGLVAVLARSGDEASFQFLREMWDHDPERRQAIALGLAQSPDGDNWDYLVRSLPVLEGGAARDIMQRLTKVDRIPENPEYLRQVILRGLALGAEGGEDAAALLEYWAEETVAQPQDGWEKKLKAWQAWFARKYPERPEATLPVPSSDSKWKPAELLAHLSGPEGGKGSAERGADIYVKAQCAKCHRLRDRGENIGPELTSLARRFTRKEVLESILYPNHVISDQFASKTVTTDKGRKYVGILTGGGTGELVVVLSTGEKVTLKESEVEEIAPSRVSAMPAGLLDNLTLEEVTDLFAYLGMSPAINVAQRKVSDQK